jgi:hypothetical protein
VRSTPASSGAVSNDAEVAQLQTIALAHEHVQRRQVAVERLAAMQLAQDLEDAGDFTASVPLCPRFAGLREEGAQVAVARVLEGQAVRDSVAACQRERVVHANRAWMIVGKFTPSSRRGT